jgi:hypothetical protein
MGIGSNGTEHSLKDSGDLDHQIGRGSGAAVTGGMATISQQTGPHDRKSKVGFYHRYLFSPRNLKYTHAFAEAWAEEVFVQAVLAQIGVTSIEGIYVRLGCCITN